MKIKLQILEKDKIYLKRFISVFNAKYADKIEIYSFSDYDAAMHNFEKTRIDIFIVSDNFEIEKEKIPKSCESVYLVDTVDIATLHGQKAICKFQKTELIYRAILAVFSEKDEIVAVEKTNENIYNKLLIFTSVSGGSGASTLAAACSLNFAGFGKKVLYLNLEKFGSSDVFFYAEGQFGMSNIIYNLKSKKSNLNLKLESCVKQDSRGVYFFSQPKIALDILELKSSDILILIDSLTSSGQYDYIILDIDFEINDDYFEIYNRSNKMIIVSDGSEICNKKIERAIESVKIIEEEKKLSLISKISIMYNKFDSKMSKVMQSSEIKSIGGIPKYDYCSVQQITEQISKMPIFSALL